MSSTPTNVDIVLVLDSSDSMKPCFDQLRTHLRDLIKPMQGFVSRVRFGLVAVSASKPGQGIVYRVETLVPSTDSANTLNILYGNDTTQHEFFTDSPDRMIAAIDALTATGDEDNLLALDIALDFPFGPIATTKRVVALFSDEPLEGGVTGKEPLEQLPSIVEKLNQRRIKLFCAMPFSDGAQRLGEANGAEVEPIDGNKGLGSVDFRLLLSQMGKSISVSSLQAGSEERYKRALFGQDKWGRADGWVDSDNH